VSLPPPIPGPTPAPATNIVVNVSDSLTVVAGSNGNITVDESSDINIVEQENSGALLTINVAQNVMVSGNFLPSSAGTGQADQLVITGGTSATYQHWGDTEFQVNSSASIDANLTGCGTFTFSSSTALQVQEGCGNGQDFYVSTGLMVIDQVSSFGGYISLDSTTDVSASTGGGQVMLMGVTGITSYQSYDGHLQLYSGTTLMESLNVDDKGGFGAIQTATGVELQTGSSVTPTNGTLIANTTTTTEISEGLNINPQGLTFDSMTFIHDSSGIMASDASTITASASASIGFTFTGGSDADVFGCDGLGSNTVINFHASDIFQIASVNSLSDTFSWQQVSLGSENGLVLTATSKVNVSETTSFLFAGYASADINTRLVLADTTTGSVVTAKA